MGTRLQVIKSKVLWIFVVYSTTMFIPWRAIYKGTSVFVVLPLWWEYGNPLKHYVVISGHVISSVVLGLLISRIVTWLIDKVFTHEK
jgi:hypothetical protein